MCRGLLDERSHERTLERMHCLLCLLPEALGSGKQVTQTLAKRGVLGAQVPILFDGEMPGVQLSFEFSQRRQAPCEYWGKFWHERGVNIVPEQAKMWGQALVKLLQQALLTAARLLQDVLFPLLEHFARIQRRNVLFEGGRSPSIAFFKVFPWPACKASKRGRSGSLKAKT